MTNDGPDVPEQRETTKREAKDCSFPRSDRLTKKSEYDFVFQNGEKAVGPHFVSYCVRQGGQGCKLGVVVSRRVGKAVVRNRVKRFLREFFRTHRRTFPVQVQLVIVSRPASAALGYHATADAIRSLLRRGGVLSA